VMHAYVDIGMIVASLKSPCLLGNSFDDNPSFLIPSENTFSHSVSDSLGDTASLFFGFFK
jgi:hypothetical protein